MTPMDVNELQQTIAMTEFQLKETQQDLNRTRGMVEFYQDKLGKLHFQLRNLRNGVAEGTSDTRTLLNG
jgi:septal ring factor EnvC (AmiA/AmiB activator)